MTLKSEGPHSDSDMFGSSRLLDGSRLMIGIDRLVFIQTLSCCC